MKPTRKGKDAVLGACRQRCARQSARSSTSGATASNTVTNARHKGMLRVILGEMLEHKRLFEQASEGRTDIIGTPLPINERRGKVLDPRWIE